MSNEADAIALAGRRRTLAMRAMELAYADLAEGALDVGTVAAMGSTQSNAAALAYGFNTVTAADATKGVILPAVAAGKIVVVINTVAAVLKVYPPTGTAINGGSDNAALSMAASTAAIYVSNGADWFSVPTVPS